MADPLVLRPLEREQIPQAFPLVRAILPDTSLSRWTVFARAYIHERSDRAARGITMAQNQAGYIAGIFTHELRDELAHGRTLSVGNLMVADFPGRERTVDHLIEGMHALANLRGCAAIAVSLGIAFFDELPNLGWAQARFVEGGFVASSPSQCRKLLQVPRVNTGNSSPPGGLGQR